MRQGQKLIRTVLSVLLATIFVSVGCAGDGVEAETGADTETTATNPPTTNEKSVVIPRSMQPPTATGVTAGVLKSKSYQMSFSLGGGVPPMESDSHKINKEAESQNAGSPKPNGGQ